MTQTTVIIVRHCEAEGNIKRVFQGHTDGKVSERGRQQLRLLSQRFRDIKVDAVYSSPLSRALETAHACNITGLPIATDPRLMEIDGGALEGMPWADFYTQYAAEAANWYITPWDFQAPGGESMRQVYDRMYAGVSDIVARHAGRTIAVASHGCAIRNLICRAKGLSIEHLNEIAWYDNTSISILTFDEQLQPSVICENDRSHLADGMSYMDTQTWWHLDKLQEIHGAD